MPVFKCHLCGQKVKRTLSRKDASKRKFTCYDCKRERNRQNSNKWYKLKNVKTRTDNPVG